MTEEEFLKFIFMLSVTKINNDSFNIRLVNLLLKSNLNILIV